MSDERSEDQPGWAAPDLPSSAPTGDTPAPPPGAPVPSAPAPAVAPPVPPTTPTAAWTPQPPGAGSAVTNAAAPATPVRKRRGWIIALVLVLGAIVLTAVAGTVLFVDRTLPPFTAANDFMNDLADGNVGGAAGHLCRADQRDSTGAIRAVTRHFAGGKNVAVNPLSVDRSGDRATVEYTIGSRGSSANDRTYELPVVLEGDTWRVCPGAPLR